MFGDVGDVAYRAFPWFMAALVVVGVAAEVGQAIRERRARRREGR